MIGRGIGLIEHKLKKKNTTWHVYHFTEQFVNPPDGFVFCLFPQCLGYPHFMTGSARTDWEDLDRVFKNKNEN